MYLKPGMLITNVKHLDKNRSRLWHFLKIVTLHNQQKNHTKKFETSFVNVQLVTKYDK